MAPVAAPKEAPKDQGQCARALYDYQAGKSSIDFIIITAFHYFLKSFYLFSSSNDLVWM